MDTWKSPAIDIIYGQTDWNATVEYHDPFVPIFDVGEQTYESVSLSDERLQGSDCVIIVTDHSSLDVGRFDEPLPLIFDT